jgi:hypothetical protein
MALAQGMHARGDSAGTIATTLGISGATIYRVRATTPTEGGDMRDETAERTKEE